MYYSGVSNFEFAAKTKKTSLLHLAFLINFFDLELWKVRWSNFYFNFIDITFESCSSFLSKESLPYFALIFLEFKKMSACGILYQFGYFCDCKHQICLQTVPLRQIHCASKKNNYQKLLALFHTITDYEWLWKKWIANSAKRAVWRKNSGRKKSILTNWLKIWSHPSSLDSNFRETNILKPEIECQVGR